MKTNKKKITRQELAEKLNNREYREEITREEEQLARDNGLIVIFGASDDNIELRGYIYDEIGSYNGTEFRINVEDKTIFTDEEILEIIDENEYLEKLFKKDLIGRPLLKAEWDSNGYSWFIYSNTIGFSPFEILEDGEKYCRGIVISIKDFKN